MIPRIVVGYEQDNDPETCIAILPVYRPDLAIRFGVQPRIRALSARTAPRRPHVSCQWLGIAVWAALMVAKAMLAAVDPRHDLSEVSLSDRDFQPTGQGSIGYRPVPQVPSGPEEQPLLRQ